MGPLEQAPVSLSPNFEARFSRIDITPPTTVPPSSQASASSQPSSAQGATPAAGRSPRKKYPQHIYPNQSTLGAGPGASRSFSPGDSSHASTAATGSSGAAATAPVTASKSPFLSTARRAESRSKSTRVPSSTTASPGTALQSTTTPTPKVRHTSNYKRVLSYEPPAAAAAAAAAPAPASATASSSTAPRTFSFMRDTTSSIKKQVESPSQIIGASEVDMSVPVKRNLSGTRQTSASSKSAASSSSSSSYRSRQNKPPVSRTRRIASSHVSRTVPTDITNFSRFDNGKTGGISHSHSHHSLHQAQSLAPPPSLTAQQQQLHQSHQQSHQQHHQQQQSSSQSSLTVPSTGQNAISSSPTTSQPAKPPAMTSRIPHSRSSNAISSKDVYNRLYNNTYKRKASTPRQDTPKVLHRSASTKGLVGMIKIRSLGELYEILYQEDPSLFGEEGAAGSGSDLADAETYTTCPPLKSEDLIGHSDSTSSAAVGGGSSSSSSLSIYERGEVLRRKDIYYVSHGRSSAGNHGHKRSINIKNYGENFGFDDKSGNYVIIPHDHINYRYEVLQVLGNGSFGNVVQCKDHKYKRRTRGNKLVAIKIIKNDLNWSLQAVYEIKMLKHLNDAAADAGNNSSNSPNSSPTPGTATAANNILQYFGHFHFRGHMCIVTEILSLNLFSLLEISSYKGFSISVLKTFSRQILQGLEFIHSQNIIHCDIKPENLMIKLPANYDPRSAPSGLAGLAADAPALTIKIIDFGSSCFKNEISYTYIQSRYYRAPEVVLGAKYSEKIDIWSLGCVLAELYTGSPLLPGNNELEQIGLILELFGSPASSLIQSYRRAVLNSIEREKSRVVDPVTGGLAAAHGGPQPVSNNGGGGPGAAGARIDEKSVKKTLLFSLFDLDGKINLQFLNMRLQAHQQPPKRSQHQQEYGSLPSWLQQNQFDPSSSSSSHHSGVTPASFSNNMIAPEYPGAPLPPSAKRTIKLNSKILDVLLKIGANNDTKRDGTNFIKFLNSIFQWDPSLRFSASELLDSPFLVSDE